MQPAIVIDSLSVVIDKKQILSNISAEVPQGAIAGLLGPSGAGKTTLIRALLGLQKPSTGTIWILGAKAGAKRLKAEIGYVTQAPSVYADLTVGENLNYFADLVGADKAEVASVLQRVELADRQHQLVASLSGGQRTRVSLAAALLNSPKLLLLDEPTVGLDPVLRQDLWAMFKKLAAAGTTILISSHVMDEADKCDRLLFLRDGQLLISDTKEAVLAATGAATMEAAFLRLAEGSAI